MNKSTRQYSKAEFYQKLEDDRKDSDFLNWIQEDSESEELSGWMSEHWRNLDILRKEFEEEKIWKKIYQKVLPKNLGTRIKSLFVVYLKVAAVFLPVVCLLGVWGYYKNSLSGDQIAAMSQLTVPKGGKAQIYLPDGSQVWLNAGSTLEYPLNFESSKREVKLVGEAFFRVKKDEKRPFTITTEKLNVQVLGTAFNLSAYRNDSHVSSTLVEGKIRAYLKGTDKEVELKPGERLILKGNMMYLSEVNTAYFTDWKDGIMRFKNTPLKEVVKKLSRWYDVDIVLASEEVGKLTLTATITMEPLLKVLKLMNVALGVTHREEHGTIVLSVK